MILYHSLPQYIFMNKSFYYVSKQSYQYIRGQCLDGKKSHAFPQDKRHLRSAIYFSAEPKMLRGIKLVASCASTIVTAGVVVLIMLIVSNVPGVIDC